MPLKAIRRWLAFRSARGRILKGKDFHSLRWVAEEYGGRICDFVAELNELAKRALQNENYRSSLYIAVALANHHAYAAVALLESLEDLVLAENWPNLLSPLDFESILALICLASETANESVRASWLSRLSANQRTAILVRLAKSRNSNSQTERPFSEMDGEPLLGLIDVLMASELEPNIGLNALSFETAACFLDFLTQNNRNPAPWLDCLDPMIFPEIIAHWAKVDDAMLPRRFHALLSYLESHEVEPWSFLSGEDAKRLLETLASLPEIDADVLGRVFDERQLSAYLSGVLKKIQPLSSFVRLLRPLLSRDANLQNWESTCELEHSAIDISQLVARFGTTRQLALLMKRLPARYRSAAKGALVDSAFGLTSLALPDPSIGQQLNNLIAGFTQEDGTEEGRVAILESITTLAHTARRAPHGDYAAPLKTVWWWLRAGLTRAQDRLSSLEGSMLSSAGDAVAWALGTCAATDATVSNFSNDVALIGELSKRRRSLRDHLKERENLLNLYEQLATADVAEQLSVVAETLKRELHAFQRLSSQSREKLSAAYVVFSILTDKEETTPLQIRQGAAIGLYTLLKHGHLDPTCWFEAFHGLYTSIQGDDFADRIVHLSSNAEGNEELLLDGIAWMVSIIEYSTDLEFKKEGPNGKGIQASKALQSFVRSSRRTRQSIEHEYAAVGNIVRLIDKYIPHATVFLREHPLRLMPLRRHRTVLGYYSSAPCKIEHWTRYSPPREVGQVHVRYLVLDDRSKPNSMGIYYKMFQHPITAVPVIFHENLHYGGLSGRVDDGMRPEGEVWLREFLFCRYLMSELTANVSDVSSYESQLVELCKRIDADSLLIAFSLNVDRILKMEKPDALDTFNRSIVSIYGGLKTRDEAKRESGESREKADRDVARLNLILTWCADVKYPTLKESGIDKRYESILTQHFVVDHRLSTDRLHEILQEDQIRLQQSQWERYQGKTGSRIPLLKHRLSNVMTFLNRMKLESPAPEKHRLEKGAHAPWRIEPRSQNWW